MTNGYAASQDAFLPTTYLDARYGYRLKSTA